MDIRPDSARSTTPTTPRRPPTPTWPNRPAGFYLAALADPDPRMRRQACAALEVMREARAVAPLIALLASDPDPDVRKNAARALGKIGGAGGCAALVVALASPTPGVRRQAIMALALLGDRSAAPAIAALVQDPDAGVRYEATMALGKLGSAGEVAALLARLYEDGDVVDPTVGVALAQIGATALESLLAALRDERAAVRARAASALMFFKDGKDRRVENALAAAEQDPDPATRYYVMAALKQVRTRRQVARVERLKARGKLGARNILDYLAHRDENGDVRSFPGMDDDEGDGDEEG